MFWSNAIRTACRLLVCATFTSRRITGSASGLSSAKRASSAVGACGSPTEAVPRSTSVPSRLTIWIWHWLVPGSGFDSIACTSSPSKSVAVMRGQATALEPGLSPQPRAQRCELAEMRRAFDGAALEAELLRGGIVVDRGVRVIDLRVQHLTRLAPRPDQRPGRLCDLGIERFCSHGVLRKQP